MSDLTAKRTLVKSPPELWEELSEVERLAKHLGAFGDITITKLEPEHTVAWEGEHASGTVSIEPSGWGTKVTLHAELPGVEEPEPPEPEPPEPAEPPEPGEPGAPADPQAAMEAEAAKPFTGEPDAARPRRGFWAWLFRTRTGTPAVEEAEAAAAEPEPSALATTEPAPEALAAAEPAPGALAAAEPEPEAVREPEPALAAEPAAEPALAAEPGAAEPGEAVPDVDSAPLVPLDHARARLILDEALDALGAAHHRPFSRA
jgi:hypothetical protein